MDDTLICEPTIQNSSKMKRQTVQIYLLGAVFSFCDGRNAYTAADI